MESIESIIEIGKSFIHKDVLYNLLDDLTLTSIRLKTIPLLKTDVSSFTFSHLFSLLGDTFLYLDDTSKVKLGLFVLPSPFGYGVIYYIVFSKGVLEIGFIDILVDYLTH